MYSLFISDNMDSAPPVKKTRSSLNPDVDFPVNDPGGWTNSGHLPTFCEVIGAVRHTSSKKVSAAEASMLVTNILMKEWTERNIYPKSYRSIYTQLHAEYSEFVAVRKLVNRGNPTNSTQERYDRLRKQKDELYDIFVGNAEKGINAQRAKERLVEMENELGVKMSKAEYEYLESQRSRIPRCDKIVCLPTKKQQRRKASLLKYQEKQKQDESLLSDKIDLGSEEEVDDDCVEDPDHELTVAGVSVLVEPSDDGVTKSVKRRTRQYVPKPEITDDPLPPG